MSAKVDAVVTKEQLIEAIENLTLLIRNMRDLYQANPAGLWLTDSKPFADAEALVIAAKQAEGGAK
jgi:hypothetical protein